MATPTQDAQPPRSANEEPTREEDVHTEFVEDDDDDDDDYLEGDAEIELGFVSDFVVGESHLGGAFANWDGGKVGGLPVWLDPNTQLEVPCVCEKNMSFLLQIYCPLDAPAAAFHRSLYVFCCRTKGCPKLGHARAFRIQLPRENPFYSDKEEDEWRDTTAVKPIKRCAVCGLRGKFACSACHVAQYCSKEHQKDHWKHGHKTDCPASAQAQKVVVSPTHAEAIENDGTAYIFPEYAIQIEHEPDRTVAQNESEARMMEAFEQANQNRTAAGADSDVFTDDSEIDLSQKDLAQMLGTTAQDKAYVGFLTRVALAKDQVLRYCRWDEDEPVLWVHSGSKASSGDIPCCSVCREPRSFEFQIMPQLLYHLKIATDLDALQNGASTNDLDWGTLVVYTCPNSCSLIGADSGVDVVEEFVWRQPPHELA
ncbi:programmed cell death protein 2 [Achlya hypogyna]|uniref:Programmed cell death protein 2 n=1 Tax=Achlya hypogyna TaxID=1202772 RepID=A0A1V9Z4D0_ACHHY|nr:programmed cell death protein 2 [Achlya hypogyna]